MFIPWTNRTQDWTNALSSGKNAPDITELGNTDTPTQASLGMLANITSDVNAWSNKSNVVTGMLANDTQSGTSTRSRGSAAFAASGTAPTSSRPRVSAPAGQLVRARHRREEADGQVPGHVRARRADL